MACSCKIAVRNEEKVEVEVSSQPKVSIRPAAYLAQERGMEVQQPGSSSILMPTSWVVKPSPTTGVLSGKAPITEASLVHVLSSSSEEHSYYSGDEVNFGDEPTLPDTSKFSHISEEEM